MPRMILKECFHSFAKAQNYGFLPLLYRNCKINLWFKKNVRIFAVQYRGVEQLVARRAHNPKVVRFDSHPRYQEKAEVKRLLLFYLGNDANIIRQDLPILRSSSFPMGNSGLSSSPQWMIQAPGYNTIRKRTLYLRYSQQTFSEF